MTQARDHLLVCLRRHNRFVRFLHIFLRNHVLCNLPGLLLFLCLRQSEFPYSLTKRIDKTRRATLKWKFFVHFSLLLNFRPAAARKMNDKKQYLSASGYNLHGSSISINVPGGNAVAGYRGSNEFIREL